MDIQEQRQGAVTVVKPVGPLCGSDADELKARVLDVVRRSLGRFVIDASAVQFADSRGLEVLKEIGDDLAAGGQSLRLCGATETLREELDLTGIGDAFEHFHDANAAVRSFL